MLLIVANKLTNKGIVMISLETLLIYLTIFIALFFGILGLYELRRKGKV